MFNSGKMYNKLDLAREAYERFVPEGKRAEDCIACRECEEKCPQQIPISEWMVHVHEVLAQGMAYEDCLE
jgi:predicted aldo/keto reductase-like oxidoreductase